MVIFFQRCQIGTHFTLNEVQTVNLPKSAALILISCAVQPFSVHVAQEAWRRFILALLKQNYTVVAKY